MSNVQRCSCTETVMFVPEAHSIKSHDRLLFEQPAYLRHCKPTYGEALYEAIMDLVGSVSGLVERLANVTMEGTGRSSIYRYIDNETLPNWHLARYIMYHLAFTSAFHRQCLTYGWVRNDFKLSKSAGGKGVSVYVPEGVISANASTLLEDYHLFVVSGEV